VADKDDIVEAEPGAQLGQRLERLAMHVVDVARRREWIGIAVAIAGIDDGAEARGGGELLREIAPEGDRAEAFMEEDEGRRAVTPGDALIVEAVAAGAQEGHCGCAMSKLVPPTLALPLKGEGKGSSTGRISLPP